MYNPPAQSRDDAMDKSQATSSSINESEGKNRISGTRFCQAVGPPLSGGRFFPQTSLSVALKLFRRRHCDFPPV